MTAGSIGAGATTDSMAVAGSLVRRPLTMLGGIGCEAETEYGTLAALEAARV